MIFNMLRLFFVFFIFIRINSTVGATLAVARMNMDGRLQLRHYGSSCIETVGATLAVAPTLNLWQYITKHYHIYSFSLDIRERFQNAFF